MDQRRGRSCRTRRVVSGLNDTPWLSVEERRDDRSRGSCWRYVRYSVRNQFQRADCGRFRKLWGINHGFLWENGGPIVNLQTLVLPGSDVTISETNYINDAGEISGFGTNSNGDQQIGRAH